MCSDPALVEAELGMGQPNSREMRSCPRRSKKQKRNFGGARCPGGMMITAPLLSLFVLPAIYKLLGVKRFLRAAEDEEEGPAVASATQPQLT